MKLGSDAAPSAVIVPAAGVVAQAGQLLAMPGSGGRVFTVGAYLRSLAGYGALDYRLCLWGYGGTVDTPNKLLGQSTVRSMSPAASAPENMLRVTADLEEPVELGAFYDVIVGVAWETDPAKQALLGGYSGTGERYRKDSPPGSGWPVSMSGCVHLTDHNQAAWIEDYEPISGVFAYRAGDWKQLDAGDSFLVVRDGFPHAAAVRVRRSGVWVMVRPAGG